MLAYKKAIKNIMVSTSPSITLACCLKVISYKRKV